MLWTGWTPLVHVALMATAGYLALVVLLRVTGPRTMSKMTPLDFVIAVTVGSAFGRTITAEKVSLVQTLWVLVEADLHEAARGAGLGSMADVHTVLLLREGSLGVVTHDQIGDGSSISRYAEANDGR